MSVESELKKLTEEVIVLRNTLSSMNAFYAQVLTKTLLTKEDILVLNNIISDMKVPEIKKKVKRAVKKHRK